MPGGTEAGDVRLRTDASLPAPVLEGAVQVPVRNTGSADYEAQCSSYGPDRVAKRYY